MEDIAMKKEYIKPVTELVVLQHQCNLLSGSPTNDVPWWDGEGGSRRQGRDLWDEEEGDEE